MTGAMVGAVESYREDDQPTAIESGNKGLIMTAITEGYDQVSGNDVLGLEGNAEFWGAATAGHYTIRKSLSQAEIQGLNVVKEMLQKNRTNLSTKRFQKRASTLF